MKTKVLRKLFAIAVSCMVAFGLVVQTGAVAFAADAPDVPEASVVVDEPSIAAPEPDIVDVAIEEPPAEPEVAEVEEAAEDEPPTETPEPGMAEVTFDSVGGKAVAPKTVAIGDPVGVLTDPTKTGCTFKGWYTEKTGGTRVTETTAVTEAVTYYARWAAKKYTAMFDPNGGKIGTKGTTRVVQVYGKKYVLPADPVRKGYTFKGWYTAKSGGSRISTASTVKITKTTRFYARWAAKKYTVMFDPAGGKIGSKTTTRVTQTYGKKYILPAAPVRDGYTFTGWYTAKTGGTKITTASVVKITKTTRVYAQWEKDFDADIVVEAKINLSGSGTGWHGKLVVQDGNSAVSFGIQHDTHSGIGPQNQDYLMFESVRNSPAYHSYTGYKAVGPGWHTIRLEYYQAENKARGYCDGEFIAEVPVQPMEQNHISVNKEAIPRKTGDTVDASFKDMFVYTTTYYYNGNRPFQEHGTFAIEKSAEKSNYPRGNYLYYEQGEVWRLYGTAQIPNGGDWDSYPLVGVRVLYVFVKK